MTGERKRPRDASDTQRQRAIRACRRHLKDLRAAHDRPPPDVVVRSRGLPARIAPAEVGSYCTSPAELCAEIVKCP